VWGCVSSGVKVHCIGATCYMRMRVRACSCASCQPAWMWGFPWPAVSSVLVCLKNPTLLNDRSACEMCSYDRACYTMLTTACSPAVVDHLRDSRRCKCAAVNGSSTGLSVASLNSFDTSGDARTQLIVMRRTLKICESMFKVLATSTVRTCVCVEIFLFVIQLTSSRFGKKNKTEMY
jgi:hypothetical protein